LDYFPAKLQVTLMPSRIKFLRSKELGCRLAASVVRLEETRSLMERIADQYRDLAEQIELVNRLWPQGRQSQ
jgi:hypothetical protein